MKLALCVITLLGFAASASAGIIVGHRGLGTDHAPEPENSIPALVSALENGAEAVEFDVQLTSDEQVILAHDVKLERLTDGKGCVAETSFDAIEKLHLRDGKRRVHDDLRVATFRDALRAIHPLDAPGRRFLADIHIKVYDGFKGDWGGWPNFCRATHYAQLTLKVLETVREEGLIDRVIFTSFDPRVLKIIRKLEPHAKVGLLSDFRQGQAITDAIGHYDAVGLAVEHLNAKDVRRAKRAGLMVFAWSPADEKQMEKLFAAYHVDGVITNDLANALRACKASCYTQTHE